ncbi:UNVERIFIED_CONTAM: hypothetical protein Slati_3701600 [Sesamum latifolium]|uniref:Uncharacterized protein n=1 Tax=Sesamum latifolium TaxID=2727402 RepID=A0AAW2U2Q3_9LAMI
MDTQGKAVKLVNSKLTISKSSSLSTKSIGVTTRSMSKKLKDSCQMTPLTKYIQKELSSPNHASEDDRNKSPPSSPRSPNHASEDDGEVALVELEEGVKATLDELKKVNLGNTEDPRSIYTSASLIQEEEGAYITLLHEFKDVFAWSYKKMPGLDPKVVVHHLSVKK